MTKTVIRHNFNLEKTFWKILYMIDVCINEGSHWIVESIESQYINISTYRHLPWGSYIGLPVEFKNPRKGLINIKTKIKAIFYGILLGILIFSKQHPERILKNDKELVKHITNPEEITEEDKEFVSDLDYDGIEFPVQEKDFGKIEVKNNICINVFGYENKLVFPIYVSDKKFEDSMDLLLLIKDDKSHYVYIKDFNRFMFHKTKNKNKKWFCKSCLQCFSSENVLTKYKEDCLNINVKQSVKLEEGIIELENYFKQIPVSFKIYVDFECKLESAEVY